MRRWIRIPAKDEKRGLGSWHVVRGEAMEADFARCKAAGLLPVAWEIEEFEVVKDERGKEPNVLVRHGALVHQFHRVAVGLPGAQINEQTMKFAHAQLKHLLETVLVVENEEKTDDPQA